MTQSARGCVVLALALALATGCRELRDGFVAGFNAESTAAPAPAPAPAEAPSPSPRVSDLPAELSREQALAWAAAHGLAELRDGAMRTTPNAALGVTPGDLARGWAALDLAARGGNDSTSATERARLLAVTTFAAGAAYPPAQRRRFLKLTALRTPGLLEHRPPRPLVSLTSWLDTPSAGDPALALVAYLQVMEPADVEAFLVQSGILELEDDGFVRDERLQPLPDEVLDAIEQRLDAGWFGPRSQVVRAIQRERVRRR